jgi:hypothetical protein
MERAQSQEIGPSFLQRHKLLDNIYNMCCIKNSFYCGTVNHEVKDIMKMANCNYERDFISAYLGRGEWVNGRRGDLSYSPFLPFSSSPTPSFRCFSKSLDG